MHIITKHQNQIRRAKRTTARLLGHSHRLRLSVFRSLSHIEGQLIDDRSSKTLVAVHDRECKGVKADAKMTRKVALAYAAGKLMAEKAKKAKITKIVFDRRSSAYHGRVKAFAQGARDGGLTF